MLIPSLHPLVAYLSRNSVPKLNVRLQEFRSISLRLPDQLYLPAPAPKPRRVTAAAPRPRRDSPPPKLAYRAPPELPKPRAAAPRKFELPKPSLPVDSPQTILQPDPIPLPPEQVPQLPALMVWTQQAVKLRPPPKKFVAPGRREVTPETPLLDAPPKLETPNREQNVADLRFSAAVVNPEPRLPVRPATTMPVRVFQPPAPRTGAPEAIDPFEGEPANIISISPTPPPAVPQVTLPAGIQVGRLPELPVEAGGSGAAGAAGAGVQGNAGEGPGQGSASGALSARSGFPGGVAGRAGTGTTGGGGAPGAASGAGGGPGGGGDAASGSGTAAGGRGLAASPTPALSATSIPIRVIHPRNEVYDVVVQSVSSEFIPEAADLLPGKPVYTVYLAAGGAKHWILQYCLPPEPAQTPETNGVIRLENPAPVRAPFPLVIHRPPIRLPGGMKYMLVHGRIDASGHFRNLRIVRGADPQLNDALVRALGNWEFRPATRDGRPVLVEMLMAIPPDSV